MRIRNFSLTGCVSTEPVDDMVSSLHNETAAIGPPAREWYRKSPGDISELGIWFAAAALYSAPGIWNRSGSIDALFTGIDARVAAAWCLVPADYRPVLSASMCNQRGKLFPKRFQYLGPYSEDQSSVPATAKTQLRLRIIFFSYQWLVF